MLIAIDVGNTNTVFGVFDDESENPIQHWRAATDLARTSDEWLMLLRQFISWSDQDLDNVTGVAICSVVPSVTVALRRLCERLEVQPLIVNWETDTGLPILLDNPSEVGADRLANAVAAFAQTKVQTIVVDLGTATTLDVISVRGEYLGGVILPGIEISLNALFQRAAALRRIELVTPATVVGKSTAAAVQSGATFGYASQVDALCERIENEIGPCVILGTGGQSSYINKTSSKISTYDPWLTLRGLRLIYQRNFS